MQLENHTLNLSFSMGSTRFCLQRIVLESVTRPIPLHSHASGCFEIHYILSGRGSILSDGTVHQGKSGSFYVTGPLVAHAQTSDPDMVMEEYCLYLKVSQGRTAESENSWEQNLLLHHFHRTKSCFLPHAPAFGPLMAGILQESRRKETGYTIQIESLFKEILVMLIRNTPKSPETETKKAASLTPDKALLLIDEAFLYEYRDLTLNGLASRLGLSRRQTERLLQQYYGKTFQQKKNDARMAEAVVLLQKQTSITHIAEVLGFSSIEHFSAAFKRYYQISPSFYRKQMEGKPPTAR